VKPADIRVEQPTKFKLEHAFCEQPLDQKGGPSRVFLSKASWSELEPGKSFHGLPGSLFSNINYSWPGQYPISEKNAVEGAPKLGQSQ